MKKCSIFLTAIILTMPLSATACKGSDGSSAPSPALSGETGVLRIELGKLIRLRRKELGITQKELAKSVGITDVYLRGIERGENTVTWFKCLKLVTILGIDIKPIRDKYIVPEVAEKEREAVDTHG